MWETGPAFSWVTEDLLNHLIETSERRVREPL